LINFSKHAEVLTIILGLDVFAHFIHKLSAQSLCAISFNLIVALVATPALGPATKRGTNGVLGIGGQGGPNRGEQELNRC
jgi:hypothetical protein